MSLSGNAVTKIELDKPWVGHPDNGVAATNVAVTFLVAPNLKSIHRRLSHVYHLIRTRHAHRAAWEPAFFAFSLTASSPGSFT